MRDFAIFVLFSSRRQTSKLKPPQNIFTHTCVYIYACVVCACITQVEYTSAYIQLIETI